MLPLRSEFQPKRPPCPAFEASPVIPIHLHQVFSEEIKKVIIQRLTPVLAVIWLRSFCAVTLRSKAPQTPLKEENVTKSAEKLRRRRSPPRDVPPSLLVEEKPKTNAFLLVSSRTRALA